VRTEFQELKSLECAGEKASPGEIHSARMVAVYLGFPLLWKVPITTGLFLGREWQAKLRLVSSQLAFNLKLQLTVRLADLGLVIA